MGKPKVRFNLRHRRSGRLFLGRCKARLVESDDYAHCVVDYVHLDPVRPKRKTERIESERAEELDGYEWNQDASLFSRNHRGVVGASTTIHQAVKTALRSL